MFKYLLFLLFVSVFKITVSQTTYTWNGSSSNSWNTNTNWTPNGVPTSTDNVIIVTGSNPCVTSSNITVNDFRLTSGTLNLVTYSFTINGNTALISGTISGTSATLACEGATTTIGNTSTGPVIHASVIVDALTFTSQRTTYNNSVSITKLAAGSSIDSWRGGNTFNGSFYLNSASTFTTDNIGDTYLGATVGDPTDVFNGRTTFYITGCARIRIPQNGNAIFNGVTSFYSNGFGTVHDRMQPARLGNSTVTFNDSTYFYCNSATTDMQIAYDPNTKATFNGPVVAIHYGSSAAEFMFGNDGKVLFNHNLTVNCLGSGAITITNGGVGTSTLVAGRTINVGSTGFSSGRLAISNFTQLGSTAQTLTLTGTAALSIGAAGKPSVYNASVNYTAAKVSVQASTFNSTCVFKKTGSGDDDSGGNTFNTTVVLNNSGAGEFRFSSVIGADIFTTPLDVYNSGAGSIRLSRTYNTTYPENITVSNTGTGEIVFGVNGGASILANNKTITVGSGGYTNGSLYLYKFSQASATAQNLNLSNAASLIMGNTGNITTGCNFAGDFTASAKGIDLTGNTFGGANNIFNKTGTGDDDTGGNTFNGSVVFNHSGSSGEFRLSQTVAADVFNSTLEINNTGSGSVRPSRNYNTLYPENITVSNTTGGGIYFGANGGTSTLANNKTIAVGAGGYANGYLYLYRFNQSSTTTQNINLSGAATVLRMGDQANITSGCSFPGDFTASAKGIELTGNTFGGITVFNQSGPTTTRTWGGNNFTGSHTINLSGVAGIQCSQLFAADSYSSTINLNLTSSGGVTLSRTYNTSFPENITMTGTSTGGIAFGFNGGSSTLANGKTISIGGTGFTGSFLYLYKFNQVGTTPQSLTLTGSAAEIQIGASSPTTYGSTFGGNLNVTAPGYIIVGSTFNGTANFLKTGVSNDDVNGGNVFNAVTSFSTTGTSGRWRLGTIGDDFNDNVSFIQGAAGTIAPTFSAVSTFDGDITVSAPTGTTMTFGGGAGRITLDGNKAQSINKLSGNNPSFTKLTLNKTANSVTLNTRINVVTDMTLTVGVMNTTSTNILNMNDGSTTNIGNTTSYINGPMNYDMALNGTRTLNMPIGKTGDWRPVVLGIKHSSSTSYTYKSEVTNASAQALGYTKPATVDTISKVHYWDVNRTVTSTGVAAPTASVSGSQTITLYYGTNDIVTDPANLTIVKNTSTATTTWIDIGGTGATAGTGSVSSTSSPSAFNSFSRFTLANKVGGTNPLPIELLSFTAKPLDKTVSLDWVTASEINNSYYDIERSADGVNFEYLTTVKAYGNGNSLNKQTYNTIDEKPYKGISYYRLKQVDKNGDYTYAKVVSVEFSVESYVTIFPNPTSNVLMFKTSDDYNNASVKIINAIGVEVILSTQMSSYNGKIDVSHLAAGIYYVVIEKGGATENIKISIQ